MRCYKVIAKDGDEVLATRIAGTNALARETRDEMVATFEVKKKDVTIEEHEVPVAKDQLIEYLNEIFGAQDSTGDEAAEK
jgi:hypothetical protein